LFEARTGATHAVAFRPFLEAYRPFAHLPNVALFARQAAAFRSLVRSEGIARLDKSDLRLQLAWGQGIAVISYAQLIAEQAAHLAAPPELVSAIFCLLASDFSRIALDIAALPMLDETSRDLVANLIRVPKPRAADWPWVAEQMCR
jgi:hypothetical protein